MRMTKMKMKMTTLIRSNNTDVGTKDYYIWTTQTGERIPVNKMTTSHLFFTVRMIYNHTAPPTRRILGCKEYKQPYTWSIGFKRKAIENLLNELKTRTDISHFMWKQLCEMRERSGLLRTLLPYEFTKQSTRK